MAKDAPLKREKYGFKSCCLYRRFSSFLHQKKLDGRGNKKDNSDCLKVSEKQGQLEMPYSFRGVESSVLTARWGAIPIYYNQSFITELPPDIESQFGLILASISYNSFPNVSISFKRSWAYTYQ